MNAVRPLAVVTGASSGIGLALARQFADKGFDLVVCAEDRGLAAAAQELRGHGADVVAVRADLATYDGVEQLYAAVLSARRPVAAAALNAGVGRGGAFLGVDLADHARIIDLNINATVHLTHRLLRGMVEEDDGRLLITSSVAAMAPGPYQTVYSASKSFLQSFAQGLQGELRDTGVSVTSLMPGATETAFFHRAGMDDTRLGRMDKDDPARVAEDAFEALMRGRDKVVAGSVRTKVLGAAAKVLPDRLKAAGQRYVSRPRPRRQ
ncbi:SDR family NAD(P)-dependent oxidoreductase [Streptomyces ficellus]|uniref:SDR family NAD(P)-dependent oxidoreductase n=1 Tax=Streptomyces ficellus TaxID=1977088 RepID=A0ABT7Z986_9ACTN|nr:SDR family NAD(P)-dependent oxidoreductase [Streptomyces ficellus]MDN3296068.1 SDR family NAD(P)-dependent oxidoreductase [Streptomyces ficellus]